MSHHYEIIFSYNGVETSIACGKHEQFKDIYKRFIYLAKAEGKSLYFIYNGSNILDDELSFKQLANYDDRKRKKMNVIANEIEESKGSQGSQNSNTEYIIKSNEIICPICYENIKFKFEDYNIILYECKNNHDTDLLFDEFNSYQNIDLSKIICQNCKINNRANVHGNLFYKCNTCKLNLCPLCFSNHDKNHIIINYDKRNYECEEHSKSYKSYCKDCKKSLCRICEEKNHEKHNILNYKRIISEKDDLTAFLKNLKEKNNKLKNQIKDMIEKLNKLKENFDYFYNICENVINTYNENKMNYEIFNNINTVLNTDILKDINNIIEEKNIKNKFNKMIDIFDKMISGKSITIIYTIYNDEEETKIFGEEFVKHNKNNCTMIIDEKKYKLTPKFYTKNYNKKELTVKLKGIQNITDASYMFYKSGSFTSPDMSKWNTYKVTNMSHMFHCNSISPLPDISKFNTSNVTTMESMFVDHGVKYFPDISKWDTSNVTTMREMFYHCSMLQSIPYISDWNVSKVTDMSFMFFCESLKTLPDLSRWNTSKVSNMKSMFAFSKSLTTFTGISEWNTSKFTDMKDMFEYCTELISLPDISKWDTHKVTDMSEMFFNCYNLASLPDISKWNTGNVTSMYAMFNNCSSLTSMPDLSKWDTSSLKNDENIFFGCRGLSKIPLIKKNKWSLFGD